ncbi:hypothetical protein ATE67_09850 [Sphingopyxis sp. H050]|jgi:hypothetical protein|uniref:hypothetical protein n=1 Tax=Sphingopyxis sp. H050 TaxID=1759072 RepID=UPI0007373B57|nr:hypothetical protein [Sphingopyxis sp. H050]KTE20542.1 hypothetical protein ATE67_09850 [Sphingopyxis sp. H050]
MKQAALSKWDACGPVAGVHVRFLRDRPGERFVVLDLWHEGKLVEVQFSAAEAALLMFEIGRKLEEADKLTAE